MKPFGYEYAYRREWGPLERAFIKVFGVVDLPTRIRAQAVLRVLRGIPCDRVLDVGSGTGVYAFYLTRDPACRVLAMDVDVNRTENIRHIARELARKGLAVLHGDDEALAALPASEAFSVVLAVEVLQYFPNLAQTLRRLFERLSPGGVLVAHVPIRMALWPYEHTLFDDDLLTNALTTAGFEPPDIQPTFGCVALYLCGLFTSCVSRPWLLAAAYPLLLLLTVLTPVFPRQGQYRLIIAHKRPSGEVC